MEGKAFNMRVNGCTIVWVLILSFQYLYWGCTLDKIQVTMDNYGTKYYSTFIDDSFIHELWCNDARNLRS